MTDEKTKDELLEMMKDDGEIVDADICEVGAADFVKTYNCYNISQYKGMNFVTKGEHEYSIVLICGIKPHVIDKIQNKIINIAKKPGEIPKEFRALARKYYAIKNLEVNGKRQNLELECIAGIDPAARNVIEQYIKDFHRGAPSNFEEFIKSNGEYIQEGHIITGITKKCKERGTFLTNPIIKIYKKQKAYAKKVDEEDEEILGGEGEDLF